MNKDFKEALEKEAHEYASLPNDDNIYHELKTGFKDGWNACYTYLHKEGGKDVASDKVDYKSPVGKFLLSNNKPFFIDTFRKNLQRFDREEISMSKLVEHLNIDAIKWHLLNSEQTTEPLPNKELPTLEPEQMESDAVAFAEWLVKRKVEPIGGGIWEDHGAGGNGVCPVVKTSSLYQLFKNKQP
jgi:hypothetical protein